MGNYLLISDAAKEVKVESHVLRYWEDELHLPIKRNELGHRYYTEEDVERFKQIKGMKERGLQLKAIKMILRDGKLDVLSTEDAATDTGYQDSVGRNPTAGYQDGMVRNPTMGYQDSTGRNPATGYQDGTERKPATEYAGDVRQGRAAGQLAIDIIPNKNVQPQVTQESKEEKSRRLQWLLQQLIRQTLQENNGQLCREIRESVVKELDYQFRMQEEREEARDKMLAQRDEEHFKQMDELLRKKTRRLGKGKPERERAKENKKQENKKQEDQEQENEEKDREEKNKRGLDLPMAEEGQEKAPEKKRRRFF